MIDDSIMAIARPVGRGQEDNTPRQCHAASHRGVIVRTTIMLASRLVAGNPDMATRDSDWHRT
jgi:hypothetical protein